MSERGPHVEDEAPRVIDPAHLPSGYTIDGKYAIKRLLGEGANGSVYEGEHTQIGHRVAIKVVHRDLAEREDIIARFRREARICGSIRNRHVGQVYDVGELPGGAPYMVMELQEGGSLARMLSGGPLPIWTAVDIGRQLLIGLSAAHEFGVIHRDVKPDNVMVIREPGGQLLVKLVDFGISKSLLADLSLRSVTLQGMVVGSPDYMPPEQLRGEEVDHRVDIYATGIVLYEVITGRVPFEASSMSELFVAILRDPLVPPSKRRSDCPAELEEVILRALARDADQRYATAADMERALLAIQRLHGFRSAAPPSEASVRESSRSQLRRIAATPETQPVTIRSSPMRRRLRPAALVAVTLAALGVTLLLRTGRQGPEGNLQRAAESAEQVSHRTEQSSSSLPSRSSPPPFSSPLALSPTPTPTPAPAPPPPLSSSPTSTSTSTPTPTPTLALSPAPSLTPGPSLHAPRPTKRPRAPAPTPATSSSSPATPVSDLVRDAAGAFVRGQLPRSRALYREATTRAPNNAEAWRGLGMASSRMGDREEAAGAFKRYLALRPNAADAAAIRSKLEGL